MAMGRGSVNLVLLSFLFIMICAPRRTLADTHVVGGSQGWGFSVSYDNWAGGKSFATGDTLVFKYQAGLHNVVPVDAAGYRSCKASSSEASRAATTGDDKFTLKKGSNYFICSIPGHCAAGMKIQVLAQ
ncbi:Chemocyanin [Ananas comosus]|uniref:Plantacyanin n=1 Tax=Ananas comosus TaxID=4615 RepID=A0A199VT59_ANACO|nr:Chemocyanin [Ananas comosus]